MSVEKFTKKTHRDASEWGDRSDYTDTKRHKSGSKKDRRANDKRKDTKHDTLAS